jgi:hypothetical protein
MTTRTTATRNQQQQDILPSLPYEFVDLIPFIIVGFFAMNGLFTLLVAAIEQKGFLREYLPTVAAEYCSSENNATTTCERPDLIAFQIISGTTFFICGVTAVWSWHVTGRACQRNASPESRLYTVLTEAKWITTLNLTYQIWDFYISYVRIAEFNTPIMMTHHVVAAIVAFSALNTHLMGYHAIFFMGLTEVSSIFLVVVDLGRYFPPIPGTTYDMIVNSICAPAFVVTFFYYRVYLWWRPVSIRLFQDVYTVLTNGRAEKLRPGRAWVLYELCLLNVPMGLLQLYWMGIILTKAYAVLTGEVQ